MLLCNSSDIQGHGPAWGHYYFPWPDRLRLQRELKSLHLTQWASMERKNNLRAENTELKLIIILAVTLGWGLGHFWCFMSPKGFSVITVKAIHILSVFMLEKNTVDDLYCLQNGENMCIFHFSAVCMLWLCLEMLQRKLVCYSTLKKISLVMKVTVLDKSLWYTMHKFYTTASLPTVFFYSSILSVHLIWISCQLFTSNSLLDNYSYSTIST